MLPIIIYTNMWNIQLLLSMYMPFKINIFICKKQHFKKKVQITMYRIKVLRSKNDD